MRLLWVVASSWKWRAALAIFNLSEAICTEVGILGFHPHGVLVIIDAFMAGALFSTLWFVSPKPRR